MLKATQIDGFNKSSLLKGREIAMLFLWHKYCLYFERLLRIIRITHPYLFLSLYLCLYLIRLLRNHNTSSSLFSPCVWYFTSPQQQTGKYFSILWIRLTLGQKGFLFFFRLDSLNSEEVIDTFGLHSFSAFFMARIWL